MFLLKCCLLCSTFHSLIGVFGAAASVISDSQSVTQVDWLLISVTTPLTGQQVAFPPDSYIEAEGPSFHQLTKVLPIRGTRCMCVCVCVSWILWKHNTVKEGKEERFLGERGSCLHPSHLSPPPCSSVLAANVLGQQEGELEEKQLINSHKVRRPALGWSVPC